MRGKEKLLAVADEDGEGGEDRNLMRRGHRCARRTSNSSGCCGTEAIELKAAVKGVVWRTYIANDRSKTTDDALN